MKRFVWLFLVIFILITAIPFIANAVLGETRLCVRVFTGSEIIELDAEEYALRVLAAEAEVGQSGETLRALAVAVRSCAFYFSLYGLKHEDFDVCADEDCCLPLAVYEEIDEVLLSACEAAVNETSGEILTLDKLPALALFNRCASSGTRFCEDLPYLTAVSAEQQCDLHTAQIEVPIDAFMLAFPDFSSDDGSCVVYGENKKCEFLILGGKKLSPEAIISAFSLPSYEFTLEIREESVIFDCFGIGHGCGLDICRAEALAAQNYDYKELLLLFYPNLTLVKMNSF